MNVLKRNNIPLNLITAYVGLENNWISLKEIFEEIEMTELSKFSQKSISDFFILSEDSKDDFYAFIINNKKITERNQRIGLKIWALALLNDISSLKSPISIKLKQIANIWASFGYLDEWKDFIYYMPASDKEPSDEKKLYDKFINYLNQENDKLPTYINSISTLD